MTITSTAPVIDATGIHIPSYADVLDYVKSKYRGIYGSDVYLEADSQDGQLLAMFASCINDANIAAVKAYNSRSPATAEGEGLSSVVKINGLKRNTAGYSTVDLQIIGVGGTTITNGIAKDANGNQWALPASVVIPAGGSITVTATCKTLGAITAAANTVNQIGTPTLGWQTVNNAAAVTAGAPVEVDPALKKRQSTSTALPSRTIFEGIVGAVAAIPGVVRYAPYENDTNSTDANGIPPHSFSIVVDGGDATAIANAIAAKKGGGGTYGTTTVTVTDAYGIPHPINFFRPTAAAITVAITIKQLTGYTSTVGTAIQQAISDYINAVAIGGGVAKCVEWDSAITAAKSVAGNNTFKIVSLALTGPHGAGTPDATLFFNEGATCTPASVTLTVT